jgi:heparan-alpha-glucosaminide N-acetyltransferase
MMQNSIISSEDGVSPLYQESLLEADRQMNSLAYDEGYNYQPEKRLDDPLPAPRKSSQRLQSLDVARGVTIALMIFVDNVGDTWPHVDHTPWNGIRLADFVMPR